VTSHDHQHGHEGAGVVRDAAYWNERYRSAPALWSGEPNPQLVDEVSGLRPGRALDVGCGEGADAVWLARRGWQVTGVDISTVAVERAAVNAGAAGADIGGRIGWQQGDLITWAPDPGRYDLAVMHFVHLPPGQREAAFRHLAAAVAPGGTLLIVAHHPSDLEIEGLRTAGPGFPAPGPELFYTGDEIAAAIGADGPAGPDGLGWRIVANEARARQTAHPEDGRTVTVHDTIFRAVRSAPAGEPRPAPRLSADSWSHAVTDAQNPARKPG